MKRVFIPIVIIVTLFATLSAIAERPGRGQLWLNGELVRTLVPPASVPPGTGTDPVYVISTQDNNVAGVGPGEQGYHGGRWAVWVVTWNAGVTPYVLTSDEAVRDAETAGHITLTRNPEGDNRCPINPGGGGEAR